MATDCGLKAALDLRRSEADIEYENETTDPNEIMRGGGEIPVDKVVSPTTRT